MLIPFFLVFFTLASSAFAWFDIDSKNNVAVYWGQNSAGKKDTQDRLTKYCNDPNVDIIILSFLIRFNGTTDGNPILNFANQGVTQSPDPVKCTLFPNSELFFCPELEQDIQACQIQNGKTILLSFGGDAYTEGGFPSEQSAIDTASKMWAMFGPPQDADYHPYAEPLIGRPFGYASVDGFDFDFEGPNKYSLAFAKRMRQLMDDYDKTFGRKFFLSGAPQCQYPDVWMGEIMEGAYLDMVFVQFYNNYCGVSSFNLTTSPSDTAGPSLQPTYNFNEWNTWANTVSQNKNVKVFMGVPGNVGAGRGYAPPAALAQVIESSSAFDKFGGVMIWDASQAFANDGFVREIKGHLRGAGRAEAEAEALQGQAIAIGRQFDA